ncbi:MAG: N-acetylmuramoyl-L-alanine amidase, partial [Oscillospiraceae bacterium]|nr:N-acetylmuramoyl-L-alanine amidase [Oscillospiraceae bacterium]
MCAATLLAAALFAFVLLLPRGGTEKGPEISRPPDDSTAPLVCLDAGHGGGDPGAENAETGRFEKDDTLAITLLIADKLTAQGADVILTRDGDARVSPEERCDAANDAQAALFVSLHRNSGGGTGVEIWTSANPDRAAESFAKDVLSALEDCGIGRNRGVRRGTPSDPGKDFIVNEFTDMPSCIIELGFIDDEEDNALFDANLDAYAGAIAGCIL